MNLDLVLHLAELLAIVPILWRANRAITRILDALDSFPPHRHINGSIVYPKQYEPTEVERLKTTY